MENKEIVLAETEALKIKHDGIKAEMLKVVDAMKILQDTYDVLQNDLYKVEEEYMNNLKKLMEE